MSEREPQYLILNENEDFSLSAHIDTAGHQRIEVTGYLERRRPDGIYRTPLIPDLFFGADGTQLDTWDQDLTVGDHIVLSRSGGNPRVPDDELNWRKVSEAPQRPSPQPVVVQAPVRTMAIDMNTLILGVVGSIIAAGVLYYIFRKK
jgi:hypothetical protein